MIFIYPTSYKYLISLASLVRASYNIQHCNRVNEQNDSDKSKGTNSDVSKSQRRNNDNLNRGCDHEERRIAGAGKYLGDGLQEMDKKDAGV